MGDPDPEGDVVLVLKDLDIPFAVWDETFDIPTLPDHCLVQRPKFLEPGVFHGTKKGKKNHQALQTAEPVNNEEIVLSEVAGPSAQDADPPIPPSLPPPQSPTLSASLSYNEALEPPEIRVRVSSRHLTLASPYFKRMLKGDWKEGCTLTADGCVSVRVMDCDPESLMIIMNIIHGHTRKVPRSVSLDMLTKIAVLIDYYECAEAVELFTDTWIDYLKGPLPTTYGRSLILWTCISWVFRKSALFKTVTTVAQMQSYEPIQTLGLPIPQSIVGKLPLKPRTPEYN
jgi:hypothetical protein